MRDTNGSSTGNGVGALGSGYISGIEGSLSVARAASTALAGLSLSAYNHKQRQIFTEMSLCIPLACLLFRLDYRPSTQLRGCGRFDTVANRHRCWLVDEVGWQYRVRVSVNIGGNWVRPIVDCCT